MELHSKHYRSYVFYFLIVCILLLSYSNIYASQEVIHICIEAQSPIAIKIKDIMKERIEKGKYQQFDKINSKGYTIANTDDASKADIIIGLIDYESYITIMIKTKINDKRFAEFANKLDKKAKSDPIFKLLNEIWPQHRSHIKSFGSQPLSQGEDFLATWLLNDSLFGVIHLGLPNLDSLD